LRRASDRAQRLVLLACVIVALVSAPLTAILAGTAADRMGLRAEHADARALHRVTATLTSGVGVTTSVYGTDYSWATARWTLPGGIVHSGVIENIPIGDKAGRQVRIWIDQTGRQANPPRTHADTVINSAIAAVVAPLIAAVLITYLYVGIVAVINRVRLRRWAQEWAEVEPRWSGRATRS
jgi:hypothetical protein